MPDLTKTELTVLVESLEHRRRGLARHVGNVAEETKEFGTVLEHLNAAVRLLQLFRDLQAGAS